MGRKNRRRQPKKETQLLGHEAPKDRSTALPFKPTAAEHGRIPEKVSSVPTKQPPDEPSTGHRSSCPYDSTISTYAYDQTDKIVKIHVEITGIHAHHKENISLRATEFSVRFDVTDIAGKNLHLHIGNLAHEVVPSDASFVVKKDKVIIRLRKKNCFEWRTLTPSDESLETEWIQIMISVFQSLPCHLSLHGEIIPMVREIWNKSWFLVKFDNINFFDPEGRLACHFPADRQWRNIDDVINCYKQRIRESPIFAMNCDMLGAAYLQKLMNRSQSKMEDYISSKDSLPKKENAPRRCSEGTTLNSAKDELSGGSSSHPTVPSDSKSSAPSVGKKNMKSGCSPPLIDELKFNKGKKEQDGESNITASSERSLAERLADCLEERANDHFKQKRYQLALDALSEISELFPNRSDIYSNRAACFAELKRYSECLDDCEKAVKLDPANTEGFLFAGKAKFAQGSPSESLAYLDKAHAIDSGRKAVNNLILSCKKLKAALVKAEEMYDKAKYDTAIEYYQAAMQLSEEDKPYLLNISECYVLSGKYTDATKLSETLLKEEATAADAYYIQGMIHYYKNEKTESFAKFDKCLNHDKDHKKATELYKKARDIYFMKDRGNDYFRNQKYSEAVDMYERGLKVDLKNRSINANLHFNIGVISMKLEKYADAVSSFSSAIALDDTYGKAFLKRAECHSTLKQFQEAVADLEVACKLSPVPENLELLKKAKCKLESLSKPKVCKSFSELQESDLRNALAERKKLKGNEYYNMKAYDTAFDTYSEAIKLDPECPTYYFNRSGCLMMLKKYEDALQDAIKCITLDKSFVKGYLRRGKIEMIVGKGSAAIESFTEGLNIDPNNKDLLHDRNLAEKLVKHTADGNKAYMRKNFEVAANCFKAAMGIAKSNRSILLKRAESLFCCDKGLETKQLLKKLPTADCYCIMAMRCYYDCEQHNALYFLDKALETDCEHKEAEELKKKFTEIFNYFDEGQEAMENLDLAKAHNVFRTAMNVDPCNKTMRARLLCHIGECFMKQMYFELALEPFTEAISLREKMLLPFKKRAECYEHLERFEDAVKDFEKMHNILPIPIHKILLDNARAKLKKNKRKDYYNILGLDSSASMDDIKKAYRRLAMEHHPDRQDTQEDKIIGEGKFKEINEAYNILSDPLKRLRYDRGEDLEDRPVFNPFDFRPFGFGSPFGYSPFDMFGNLFFHRRQQHFFGSDYDSD